ncbi:hypothetical protein [Dactylosporangium darangshiense]
MAAAVVRNTLQGIQDGSIVGLYFWHFGTVTASMLGPRPVMMGELVG